MRCLYWRGHRVAVLWRGLMGCALPLILLGGLTVVSRAVGGQAPPATADRRIVLTPAVAGSFDLSWSSIDGGGGMSAGGGFTLSGVMGQADAGVMTGDGYVLEGGLLSGVPETTPSQAKVYLPVMLKP